MNFVPHTVIGKILSVNHEECTFTFEYNQKVDKDTGKIIKDKLTLRWNTCKFVPRIGLYIVAKIKYENIEPVNIECTSINTLQDVVDAIKYQFNCIWDASFSVWSLINIGEDAPDIDKNNIVSNNWFNRLLEICNETDDITIIIETILTEEENGNFIVSNTSNS